MLVDFNLFVEDTPKVKQLQERLKHKFEHSQPDVFPLSAALPTSAGLPAPLQ